MPFEVKNWEVGRKKVLEYVRIKIINLLIFKKEKMNKKYCIFQVFFVIA